MFFQCIFLITSCIFSSSSLIFDNLVFLKEKLKIKRVFFKNKIYFNNLFKTIIFFSLNLKNYLYSCYLAVIVVVSCIYC